MSGQSKTDGILPVTPDRLDDLADLFESNNATNGCWCMAFIAKRSDYVRGGSGAIGPASRR